MSITYAYGATLSINATAKNTLSGDQTGSQQVSFAPATIIFAAAGGNAPTISGFVTGKANASTTPANLMLAHATNILTNFSGTAVYSDGFTVAGSKVKMIAIQNLDTTNSITIATPATNFFPLIQAASQSLRALAPGDIYEFFFQTGSVALTTGTNDALALTAGAGTPQFSITVFYGP